MTTEEWSEIKFGQVSWRKGDHEQRNVAYLQKLERSKKCMRSLSQASRERKVALLLHLGCSPMRPVSDF